MTRTFFTLTLMTISFSVFSQDFEIPKNYKFDKAEDYALYEQNIIDGVDWLMQTPLNEQTEKRKEVNAFLLKWLTGSPNVHLEIKQEIVTFMSSSPDLLIIFMGGWAKYSLESKDFDNKASGSLAGINAVLEFYEKNRKVMKKDKNVEKYIKMKSKETLKAYIAKNA